MDNESSRTHHTIDLQKLERESRKFLYIGLLLGMVLHIMAGIFIPYTKVEITRQPLKTISVTLRETQPLETEPLEITPPEIRQKTYVTKQFRQGMPSEDIEMTIPSYDEASPNMMGIGDTLHDIENQSAIGDGKALPGPLSDYKGIIDRRPKDRLSVTDEMISIRDLDTGQYKSMLIIDPTDPLNTKGYVHIPLYVEGITFKPHPFCKDALIHLAESFYRFTGITLKLDHSISLSSRELMKYPFIYMSWNIKGFDFSAREANNFRTFLDSGGFALAEVDYEFFQQFYHYIKEKFGDSVRINTVADNVYASLIERPRQDKDDGAYINSKLCIIHSRPFHKGHEYGSHWMEQEALYTKWGINILYYALTESPRTVMMVDDSSRAIKNSRQWWDYDMRKKYNKKSIIR